MIHNSSTFGRHCHKRLNVSYNVYIKDTPICLLQWAVGISNVSSLLEVDAASMLCSSTNKVYLSLRQVDGDPPP